MYNAYTLRSHIHISEIFYIKSIYVFIFIIFFPLFRCWNKILVLILRHIIESIVFSVISFN